MEKIDIKKDLVHRFKKKKLRLSIEGNVWEVLSKTKRKEKTEENIDNISLREYRKSLSSEYWECKI